MNGFIYARTYKIMHVRIYYACTYILCKLCMYVFIMHVHIYYACTHILCMYIYIMQIMHVRIHYACTYILCMYLYIMHVRIYYIIQVRIYLSEALCELLLSGNPCFNIIAKKLILEATITFILSNKKEEMSL